MGMSFHFCFLTLIEMRAYIFFTLSAQLSMICYACSNLCSRVHRLSFQLFHCSLRTSFARRVSDIMPGPNDSDRSTRRPNEPTNPLGFVSGPAASSDARVVLRSRNAATGSQRDAYMESFRSWQLQLSGWLPDMVLPSQVWPKETTSRIEAVIPSATIATTWDDIMIK